VFGKSWLTTLVGLVGAVARLITAYLDKGVIDSSDITAALTYIAMGASAKAFNVSGGKK
jgi:hypothetical protein